MYYDLSTVTFDIERQIRELEQKLIAANQVHDREKYMECRRKIRELETKLEEMRNRQERLKMSHMVPPLDAMLKLEIDHYYLSLQLKKAKKAKDEKKIKEIVKEMQMILDILDGD